MKRRISAADRPYIEALAGGLVRQGYRRVAIEAVWDVPAQEMLGGAKYGSLDCQSLHDDVAYALNIAAAE